MELTRSAWEGLLFGYIDQARELLSSELWQNMLLDCSKNELFVMVLLYRYGEVNMSQIADYLLAPLNTATGIIGRMEKRGLVERRRSQADKRVVTVVMTQQGQAQIAAILEQMLYYGRLLAQDLSAEEFQVLRNLLERAMTILRQQRQAEGQTAEAKPPVRRIVVE